MKRVSDSKEFEIAEGVNTNHIEGFFSRIKRAHVGIHHRFSVKYFDLYAAELAFREDNLHVEKGRLLLGMIHLALAARTSRNLCGYWQGRFQRSCSMELSLVAVAT